ncbi:MAG TPA: GxxExxY protein [Acidobacteriota bacterium]|jgi:GxxExxY protein
MEIFFKDLSYSVVGALMEVHRVLGPGFLEKIYCEAVSYELSQRGLLFEREVAVAVLYKGQTMGDYRCDFVIEKSLILEIKAISRLTKAHQAQALNYLAGSGIQLAILANFGASSLEYQRVVRKSAELGATPTTSTPACPG